jgi:hypothetical protein
MTARSKKLAIWLLGFGALVQPARSQSADKPEIISVMPLESFQKLVQGMGFECTRNKDDKGNLEDYFVFRAEGYKVGAKAPSEEYVYLFNVFTDKVPIDLVNEWNRTHNFSRAYLGNDNLVYLDTEIVIHGGVSRENIESQIKQFRDSVARWARFILEHQKAAAKQ